ncbi:MAG TPA: serine/threonine-protein kinase, partial [Thermoanaerobaculia bacterium]|nr:serine/threonine-protein kinase [Thermoanaerobaculia bacterium]
MLEASGEESALSVEPEEGSSPASGVLRIGPYRLLRLLARGGMGEVHLAERTDGAFQQLVAIKLLRPGLESSEMLARFELERELLASLSHPAVVPLLDGGTTEEGRPYLVLQYVEGEPITLFCQRRRLGRRERVRLLVRLCHAVEYAHRNLIVHRDLKPSNILVSGGGEVRLLDFGIAKLLSSEPPRGEATRAPLAPMTPERAAP